MQIANELFAVAAVEAQVDLVAASLALLQLPDADDAQAAEGLDRLARAQQAVTSFATGDSPGELLALRLQLSAHEMSVIWLLVAIGASDSVRTAVQLVAGAAGDDPTLRCVQRIVFGARPCASALHVLGAHGRLRRLGLIVRTDGGSLEQPEGRRTWAVAPRVLAWLLGDASVAPEVQAVVRTGPATRPRMEWSSSELDDAKGALLRGDATLVVASGPLGSGRRTHLQWLAAGAELDVLEIDAAKLAADHETCRRQLKQIARDCLLLGRVPCVVNVDLLVVERDATRLAAVGSELAAELEGPVFVTCGVNKPAMRWGRPTIVVDVKPPTSEQRAALWLAELGQGTADDGDHLATMFPLAPAVIHHAARAAKARANGRPLQPEHVYAGVRAELDDRLGDYARRVEVSQTWDDLVLPDDHVTAIRYLIARVRQRRTVYEQWGFAAKVGKGLGTSVLFTGPPGTGKTMVAGLIARELGLELYQVDMAKVVSKWIGETERNLAAVFDAAEAGNAVLLFDEADALFGKRTEVKSSNDRYANLETNYLLQRLESFTGICLLTSNHEAAIDPAFERRLSLQLRFELPDPEVRGALWQAMLPDAAPVAPELDVTALARRFVMSGGYIRNAALRAAFLAADEGVAITSEHLERAAILEYEGMGRLAA